MLKRANDRSDALQKQIQDIKAACQQPDSSVALEDRIFQIVNQQFAELKQRITHLTTSSGVQKQSTDLSYAQVAKMQKKVS